MKGKRMLALSAEILIADDSKDVYYLIKHILKELGYRNVTYATDGMNALHILKTSRCDLLITDWNMPRMDGLALLETIREDRNLQNLPVLFLTAVADEEKVLKAVEKGVDSYILKPFSKGELEKKIGEILLRNRDGSP